jgi:Cu+-exporting ATPase
LLTGNGLGRFYDLAPAAGVRPAAAVPPAAEERFRFLDDPAVRERLVDFADERITRVTFHLPAIHCLACVWLLENLFRLQPGLGASQVNFPRKEVAITLATGRVKLSEVATLLASLGYEPEFKLADLDAIARRPVSRRLWLQLGVAGFAFGNIMLFSLASYFGLDRFSGPGFRELAGWLSLLLAVPVVGYSARDYFVSAWTSLRHRLLNIDVPIAAGIIALFVQSTYEVVTGQGEGYFDSLAGLLFFLLCGKLFQQKTCDRLAFDRDYKSFFPLSVTRRGGKRKAETREAERESWGDGVMAREARQHYNTPTPQRSTAEERVALSQLAVGDHLLLRNGELIPADARLVEGPALIDYSFVTGESEPVEKRPGDYLYAGGRQLGGAIEVETVKPVAQSYLTSLWNQEAFRKEKGESFDRLTNTYSQRFTKVVIAIALGSALCWAWAKPALSVKAFTSVLIVACPCALALAVPFALGTAQRVLARRQIFLKSPHVLETLARVDAAAFDKTGTLTAAGAAAVAWQGAPLSECEERWLYSMTRHSTHPLAVRIGAAIAREHFPEPVWSFLETAGCGMEGTVAGQEIWMGSAAWLESRGARPSAEHQPPDSQPAQNAAAGSPATAALQGSTVQVAINGVHRGGFTLTSALRPAADALIARLAARGEVALLSGDNARERERFAGLFGPGAQLHFNQSPLDKLGFIRRLQAAGRTVMMVGDGLNDAGALRQSDVGVAVVEGMSAFSPASDVILKAAMVPRLAEVLQFARQSVRVVRASFLISAAYNVVGIAIAAQGLLSPVVCAILMPLSSVTVAGFACGMTAWLGRRLSVEELRVESRGAVPSPLSTINSRLPDGGAA